MSSGAPRPVKSGRGALDEIPVGWGSVVKVCGVCSAAFFSDFSFCPLHGARLREEGAAHLVGAQVDRFPLVAKVTDGRLGRVYRAELGEKKYAVKVLVGDLSADQDLVKQFRRSAHLLSKVRHPSVAEIVEFDTTRSGLAFVASNWVAGRSLAKIIEEEAPLPRARVDAIIGDLAAALAAAHAQGLVYRDLRPANVRVTSKRAVITDFALVGLHPNTTRIASEALRYAAPECVEEHIGPASDLYSLGVILADLVQGGRDDGHPLLPLLLHRLPEGRLKSADDVLAELDPKRRRQQKVATDDLELVSSDPPGIEAEWASHITAPEPLPVDDDAIEDIEVDVDIEVVVGDPDRSTPWPKTPRALADELVALGLLTEDERDRVLEEVESTHKRLMQVVAEMLPVAAERATKALSLKLGIDLWNPAASTIHPRVLATIPRPLAIELGVVPYALRAERDGHALFVALADPVDKPTRQAIEAMVENPVVWRLAASEDVDAALEAAYGKEVRRGVPATMRIRRPEGLER